MLKIKVFSNRKDSLGEGPLWCPDGSLLFQDNKAEKTYRIDADRSVRLVRERRRERRCVSSAPNSTIIDA